MNSEQTRLVMLFGTGEAPGEQRLLTAGPLEAVLDQGALRNISFAGHEAIRGIAYVLRDRNWATPIPEVLDLAVEEERDGFRVTYRGRHRTADARFAYSAVIEGSAQGRLSFSVEAVPESDWVTNRTGFVVLHPVDGVAGEAVSVLHTDGGTEDARFPDLISPSQPFFDIRAMTHKVAETLKVTCTMEGDAFEAEDQRNWTDASYKTYVRPLSKPRPYAMKAGVKDRQAVRLSFEGEPARDSGDTDAVTVTLGAAGVRTMPVMALALDPDQADQALGTADTVRLLAAGALFCHHDPSRGHGAADILGMARLCEAVGADPVLEAVLPLQRPDGSFSGDVDLLDREVRDLAECAGSVAFTHVSASPLAYHKSYQPNETWPDAPPLETVCDRLRRAFPKAAIGGGMHSYFTELNRKPPPAGAIDFITHTTCPMVHAGDDASVMESLEALPSVMRSAMAMAPGKPYWIGPSAIGMRFNPYGAAPMENPDNRRVAMARVDPRQRGLFNAAWMIGYAAPAAAHGLAGLCLAAPTGPFGLVYAPQPWQQPWFDDEGGQPLLYPAFHVFRDLARHAGRRVVEARSSAPSMVQALAFEGEEGTVLWLANLTPASRRVALRGFANPKPTACHGDTSTFTALARDPDAMAPANGRPADPSTLELAPYGVCRLTA